MQNPGSVTNRAHGKGKRSNAVRITRKTSQVKACTVTFDSHTKRLAINDRKTGMRYFVDTEADVSVIPKQYKE